MIKFLQTKKIFNKFLSNIKRKANTIDLGNERFKSSDTKTRVKATS